MKRKIKLLICIALCVISLLGCMASKKEEHIVDDSMSEIEEMSSEKTLICDYCGKEINEGENIDEKIACYDCFSTMEKENQLWKIDVYSNELGFYFSIPIGFELKNRLDEEMRYEMYCEKYDNPNVSLSVVCERTESDYFEERWLDTEVVEYGCTEIDEFLVFLSGKEIIKRMFSVENPEITRIMPIRGIDKELIYVLNEEDNTNSNIKKYQGFTAEYGIAYSFELTITDDAEPGWIYEQGRIYECDEWQDWFYNMFEDIRYPKLGDIYKKSTNNIDRSKNFED